MTVQDRNDIYETVNILRALGGQNGFSNLRPKIKKLLLNYANRLNDIADRDSKLSDALQNEEFSGETVYEV